MDFRVEILRSVENRPPLVVATIEWKYRTLEEAKAAGQREVEVTAESNSATGFRVLDEAGNQIFLSP